MQQVDAYVISNQQVLEYHGTRYYLLEVKAPPIGAEAQPGQFCMVKCGPDTLLRRPLSIHSINRENVLFLYSVPSISSTGTREDCGKSAGAASCGSRGKAWLANVQQRETVSVLGPLGNSFHLSPDSNKILLAAGGIGIAPLRFLAEKALRLGIEVTILMTARYVEGLYPDKLLPQGAAVIKAVEFTDVASGHLKGIVTDNLPGLYNLCDSIYACGPKAMLEAIDRQMQQLVIEKPAQVSLEVRMGCGTGICYGCSIRTKYGTKRVCKEGPVFDIKDIIWQEVTT